MGKCLFEECVAILKPEILSNEESDQILLSFESIYPLTLWAKMDWSKVKEKVEIGYEENCILPLTEQLLGHPIKNKVYLVWNDGELPIIKTSLDLIVQFYDDVTCVGFEKFIFDLNERFIIEILPGGLITAGIVPERIKQNKFVESLNLQGGIVEYNDFDIDENLNFYNQRWSHKEDILQIRFGDSYLIDVGWYPEFNPEGHFIVEAIKNEDWENPIGRIKTRSLDKLKVGIEKLAQEINKEVI